MPRGKRRRARGVRTLDSSISSRSGKGVQKRGYRPRRATGRSSARIDPVKLLEGLVDDISVRLGLDVLGLTREQLIEALQPVIEGILESYSSRPSKEAILSRLVATSRHLYMLLSAYILEKSDKLTPEQLEFVISYGEAVAARHVSRLYAEARRLNREDLVPMLRVLWEKYGSPTPIACPYCGFRAVTPELVCMVCGHELTESDVKKAIDFREKLMEFVELYSPRDVEEAVVRGYVIVGDTVKPPSQQLSRGEIILHLSAAERNFLKSLLAEKRVLTGLDKA